MNKLKHWGERGIEYEHMLHNIRFITADTLIRLWGYVKPPRRIQRRYPDCMRTEVKSFRKDSLTLR